MANPLPSQTKNMRKFIVLWSKAHDARSEKAREAYIAQAAEVDKLLTQDEKERLTWLIAKEAIHGK